MKSESAKGAAMIKKFIKDLGVAASVRSENYSMGSSINVSVEDQPPAMYEKIKSFANNFQYGHFNGMEDIYEYSNNRKDIPQAKFVFVNNKISSVLKQEIWDYAKAYYSGLEEAPSDVAEACKFYHEGFHMYGDQFIYKLFNGDWPEFWDSALKQEAAA